MIKKDAYIAINHKAGRVSAFPVDLIVIHVTEGNADSVVSWFNSPSASVSAHYMVRKDGVVLQFVREADTAWHAGRVDHPTAELVIMRQPANPNGYSIGIEHEGDGHHELTDEQRKASIELIQDICMRRDIPANRRHIVGHHEIYQPKTCPGAINVDQLVADVCAAGVKA
jgi:N-acetylmuramoyl-L-alanine amidase